MPAMPVRSFTVYWADKTTGISDDLQPKSANTYFKIIIQKDDDSESSQSYRVNDGVRVSLNQGVNAVNHCALVSQKLTRNNEKAKTISSDYASNCIKNDTAKMQIPIASFIPIYTDVVAAESNKRFMPGKQRRA